MKIFTVAAATVKVGAEVLALTLASGVQIPVVTVGEEGRGRKLDVLPVKLLPESQPVWDYQKKVRVENVRVGETHSGRPKLIEIEPDGNNSHAVIVMATQAGFRGNNRHGAQIWWRLRIGDVEGRFKSDIVNNPEIETIMQKAKDHLPYCHSANVREFVEDFSEIFVKGDLPGQVIAHGEIAEGAAGRAGGGEQFIAIMPKDTHWAAKMLGRLYGKPSSYEYVFDGQKVIAYTARDLELIEE